jgi:hypothetical protein
MSDPELRSGVSFFCPFCQLKVKAGEDKEDGEPVVYHLEPTCEKFEALDIDEFMLQCRVLLEQRGPN